MSRPRPLPRQPKLHRRLSLHPVSLFVLACAGVVLTLATLNALADNSYVIKATVAANPITAPAVIDAPVAGRRFTNSTVTVTGTCPNDSYVKLYINGGLHGSAVCQADNSFSLITTLQLGRNELQAQVYNVTDQAGPASDTVVVYYDAPADDPAVIATSVATTDPNDASGESATDQASPVVGVDDILNFSCKCLYQAVYNQDDIVIPVTLTGGASPYDLNINWGDGKTNTYLDQPGPVIVISHRYDNFNASLKTFTITVNVEDNRGVKSTFQIFQLVRNVMHQPAVINPTIPVKPTPWPWLWSAFDVITLMVLAFWLGERHELDAFKAKHRAKAKSVSRRRQR